MVAADAAGPQPRPATGRSSGNPGPRERRALRTRAHAPGQGLAYTRPRARAPLLWPLPGEHRDRQAKISAPSHLARMLVQPRLQNKDRAESLGSEATEARLEN